MTAPTIEEIVNCPALPSLPAVAVQVLDLTGDPNVRLEVIARAVQNDQGLSSKILRTVNSSYYGLSKPCPSIKRAMTFLGLGTVKSLALSFSLVDMSRAGKDGLDLVDYWRRCVYAAAAARRIGMLTDLCDPDEAFLAALMQDIGMLAIHASLGKRYADVIDHTLNDHRKLPIGEQEIFGFTHAQIGAELARRWRFPSVLVDPIEHHHDDTIDASPNESIIRAIVLANRIVPVIENLTPETLSEVINVGAKLLSLSSTEVRDLVTGAAADATSLATSLDVTISAQPLNHTALLARAEEAHLQLQLGLQRETEELRQSNRTLAKQTITDALTQVGNRQQFDHEIVEQFALATETGAPLCVILVDADKFKNLNDTHGHQAGDAVLVELAHRMKSYVGERGVVCRYGGEEFAIIAPGLDRPEGAKLADGARQAIDSTPFDVASVHCDADELAVSVSMGVAVLEPAAASIFIEPKVLVQAADRALYAAKESGRNCVRVFTPRAMSNKKNAA